MTPIVFKELSIYYGSSLNLEGSRYGDSDFVTILGSEIDGGGAIPEGDWQPEIPYSEWGTLYKYLENLANEYRLDLQSGKTPGTPEAKERIRNRGKELISTYLGPIPGEIKFNGEIYSTKSFGQMVAKKMEFRRIQFRPDSKKVSRFFQVGVEVVSVQQKNIIASTFIV